MDGPFLSGRVDHSLDEKGRVILPATYREAFLGEAYLVPSAHGEPFVRLYSPAAWREYDSRHFALLDELNDVAADRMIGDLYEDIHLVVPDKQGRFVIPQSVIDQLGLSAKVRLTGHRDHLRLWDPGMHERFREARALVEPTGVPWRGGGDVS